MADDFLAIIHLDSEIEDLEEAIKKLNEENKLSKINVQKKQLYLEKLNILDN